VGVGYQTVAQLCPNSGLLVSKSKPVAYSHNSAMEKARVLSAAMHHARKLDPRVLPESI